jgi:nucleoside-triphosphatase THEP1
MEQINNNHKETTLVIFMIHGPMGSGKSTLSKLICDRAAMSGKTATVLPFAKPLKDAARVLGWNGQKDKKGRRLLQLLGTEVGRKCISESIWTDKWQKAVSDAEVDNDIIVCDDLRFLNEYEAAKIFSMSRRVIAIKLKGRGYATSGFFSWILWHFKNILGLLHASEKPLPDYLFDEVYKNDKSISHLEAYVELLFDRAGLK